MVISPKHFSKAREAGALTTELVIALAILGSTMIPLSFSFLREQKLLKIYYQRSVAMEIVDGEMEILQAGEWKNFKEGSPTLRNIGGLGEKFARREFYFYQTRRAVAPRMEK